MSQVNFILTAGELTPQYRRAIRTAYVHRAPIVLHYLNDKPDISDLGGNVFAEPIELPSWLTGVHPAHVWDALAFRIGYAYGGLVLGLDTISVRPAWDLLGNLDLVASRDFSEEEMAQGITASPYTMTFVARAGSLALAAASEEAERRVKYEPEVWAYTGPDVLRDVIDRYPKRAAGAPYPALCGWNSRYIWKFYLGKEAPADNVSVIHLFSQGYRALYEGRWTDWLLEYPEFADDVATRTTLNDWLLAGPS